MGWRKEKGEERGDGGEGEEGGGESVGNGARDAEKEVEVPETEREGSSQGAGEEVTASLPSVGALTDEDLVTLRPQEKRKVTKPILFTD